MKLMKYVAICWPCRKVWSKRSTGEVDALITSHAAQSHRRTRKAIGWAIDNMELINVETLQSGILQEGD